MAIGYVEWVNPNALPTGLTCFMGVQSVGFLATDEIGISCKGVGWARLVPVMKNTPVEWLHNNGC